jgi:4-amino-4-deoxy-L-arabinose transferase-like glycosyltransferase
MEIARIVTAVVGALSVTLAGLLVRHRGVLAATVACGILAIYPPSINAAHTVLLEPWLVVFCLLGALVLFKRDDLRRRSAWLAWGGVLFGLGAAVKLWAVFPILVLLVLTVRLPSWRPRLAFLGGLAAGFLVPVLPFAALAPHTFYQSVVTAQLTRVDVSRVADSVRLINLSGMGLFSGVTATQALIVAIIVALGIVGCAVGAGVLTRRWPPELEWFAFGSTILVLASFLWPSDFYPHYGAFLAPFLALAIALPLGRLVSAIVARGSGRASRTRRLLAPGVAVVAIGLFAYLTIVETNQLSGLATGTPGPSAARVIPPDACVLTDLPGLTIVANRYVSTAPGCSPMVDGIGTDYALASGRNGVTGAGRYPAVRAVWLSAFEHAQYVWLQCGPNSRRLCVTNRRIPWTPGLRAYFATHFRLVAHSRGIYVRIHPPSV